MRNAITWFEIPAVDFGRAVLFYTMILETQLKIWKFGGTDMATFPYDSDVGVGWSIAKNDTPPSEHGVTIYLNTQSEQNLDKILARVDRFGGKVLHGKQEIPDIGFIAFILDTEGNRIGLHAYDKNP